LGLSGCHVPVIDKEVTIPFFEKTGEKSYILSMEAMKQMKSYAFNGSFDISVDLNSEEFGFLDDKAKDNILALINEGSPKVLGIDNVSEENVLSPVPMLANFPDKITISYKLKGKTDKTDDNNPKIENNVQFTFDIGGMKFDMESDVKIVDNVIYIRFLKVPFFVDSLLANMDFSLGNDWWKIDLTKLSNLAGNVPSNFGALLDENNVNKEKIKEANNKIFDLAKDNLVVNIEERLRDEKIDGEKHYHYKSTVNIQNIIKLASSLSDISYENNNGENQNSEIQKEMFDEFGEKAKDLSNSMTKSDIDFWINKKTFNLRKTVFDFSFDVSKIQTNKETAFANSGLINVNGTFEYYDIGTKMSIEAPENSEEFFSLLMDKLEKGRIKSRDARRVSDAKQIQTALELYYNDNGKFPNELKGLLIGGGDGFDYGMSFGGSYLFDLPSDSKPNSECGEDYEYNYSLINEGNNYDLSFCLEDISGKYQKGVNTVSSMISSSSRLSFQEAQGDFQGAMLDSDGDGLNDFEEEMVYFTDVDDPDTDKDGFSDGDEVKNGYNPNGNGKLNDECFSDSDCEKYISYESCEVLCVHRSVDKNLLADKTICDSEEWIPEEEFVCSCNSGVCSGE